MFKELFTEAQHPGLKKFKEFEKLLSRSKGHYEIDLKNGNFVATFDNEDDAYNFDMSAMKVIRNKPNPEAWDIDSLNKEVIIMAENLTESKKIILKGSESKVQAAMDRLQLWNEKNSYPFQEYTSYTKDYRNYVIEVDDIDGYNKHKKQIDKLLKESDEPKSPKGYKHFDESRQLKELSKILKEIGVNKFLAQNPKQNVNAIKKELNKIRPPRDLQNYFNYVFTFALPMYDKANSPVNRYMGGRIPGMYENDDTEEISEKISPKILYSKLSKMNMSKLTKFAAANATLTDVLNGLESSDDVISGIMDYFYHDIDWFGAVSGILESKPKVVDTYEKLKDLNLLALKGYARRVGLSSEIIRDFKHEEMALDEIMDFLYTNKDWLKELMDSNVI